jgi:hypothetical protein
MSLIAVVPGLTVAASPAEPRAFTARYTLEIQGWPNASVVHRLSGEGSHWESDMRAAISIAEGKENSRFIATAQGVESLNYFSGYSLMGVGGSYHLADDELGDLPDRQAALFDLSRRAMSTGCRDGDPPCELRYLDHKGEPETLRYRILERRPLSLAAGDFEAVTVETWKPSSPQRRLVFRFHPELPGLLLAVDYHRDGRHKSRLSLDELSIAD